MAIEVRAGEYTGGLVGKAQGARIQSCFSKGQVYGNSHVGGIAGFCDKDVRVINSYSHSSIAFQKGGGGGAVGKNLGVLEFAYSLGEVKSSVGELKNANLDGAGGLVGIGEKNLVLNSYWDKSTSGISESAGGEPRITLDMKKRSNYVDWDFEKVWKIDNNYPKLSWEK